MSVLEPIIEQKERELQLLITQRESLEQTARNCHYPAERIAAQEGINELYIAIRRLKSEIDSMRVQRQSSISP